MTGSYAFKETRMKRVVIFHTIYGETGGPVIHKICAEGIGQEDLAYLREMVTEALESEAPVSVVANYNFTWELISQKNRLEVYVETLDDNTYELLSQCHQKVGKKGGSEPEDIWLLDFLSGRTPFTTSGDKMIPVLPGGVLFITGYDYSK
jgi:hypothetical protein